MPSATAERRPRPKIYEARFNLAMPQDLRDGITEVTRERGYSQEAEGARYLLRLGLRTWQREQGREGE